MAHRAQRHRGSRWIAYAAMTLVALALGSGIARASVAGGGARVAAGGHFAGGHPGARSLGNGRVGRAPFRHRDHRGGGFVDVYPYYGYDPYDPADPEEDAYCDPWSSYYSLQLCYGP